MLKFFPNLSPAENLAMDTIQELTFGLLPSTIAIILLGIWETAVGLLLILNIAKRTSLQLAILHMLLTFTPMLFFPERVFSVGMVSLTLLGQYIIKNIVFLSALVMMYLDAKDTGMPRTEKTA
ncbi:MAG: doxx family protein [Flavobacteriales bacterium]|nr:MAG: doxx family protein [Flavobacteriales bacterium]